MATTKKKKPLASHLTDFEKLAGTILLVVYLAVLPFFAGPLIDWFCGLLGFSVSRAASNVICFYLLFAAAVLIFHSFLYQTSQTLFKALEHCCKTLGLSLVFFYGLNEIVYRLSHLLWGNPTNLNDAALLTQLTAAPRMMAIVVIFLAPFLEELLLRGLVFGWLREHSRAVAYVVSCLLFSLYHVWQYVLIYGDWRILIYCLLYLPASIGLAWAYDRSGSIWGAIILHGMVNGISLSVLSSGLLGY